MFYKSGPQVKFIKQQILPTSPKEEKHKRQFATQI